MHVESGCHVHSRRPMADMYVMKNPTSQEQIVFTFRNKTESNTKINYEYLYIKYTKRYKNKTILMYNNIH